MTEICELSDTELDAVCGGLGSLVNFNSPLVSIGPVIDQSFNTQLGLASNFAVITGIGSTIGLGQGAANGLLQGILG